MAKLTLSDINSTYGSIAVQNANNEAIEGAIENTLSRDGTAPNQMLAQLDMNTNRIINLAAPVNVNDAVRYIDVQTLNLPEQAGHSGQYLRSNGTLADWAVPPASEISNTPAGTIAATDVQAALNELDTEKLALAGGTMTGPITFTPQAAPAHTEGVVWYDSGSKTLSYYNEEADVTLNVGQENQVRVRNTTGSTITNGSAVYVNGSQGANLPTVALARADAIGTAEVLGLATHDIENNSNGYVTTLGSVNDVDTSSWAAGAELYLSTSVAGGLTDVKPSTGFVVPVGYVLVSNVSVGEIKVKPGVTYLDTKTVLTDSTQTLTNKTINLSNNTLTGTLAQFNTALSGADFASLAGAETLTNKTISSGTLSGTTTITGLMSSSDYYLSTRPLAADTSFAGMVTGDATARIRIGADGIIDWSNGTSTWDTNLYRSAADTLTTNDAFTSGVSVSAPTISAAAGGVSTTGGVSFGSFTGATATDLSKHLKLWSTTYGLNVTANTINVVVSGTNTLSSTPTAITSRVAHNFSDSIDINGNITVSGTVDGRDIASDGTTQDSHIAATAAHGATGAVVGTTNTQTLTNKTLTTPTIDSPILTLKQSAAPTPTGEGLIEWDTDDNKIKIGDGAATRTFSDDSVTTGIHGVTGAIVGTSDSQTLTNKTISADNNTLSGIAASSFVLSNASGNIDGAAAQKAIPAGVVVGTTDSQTLTNKTISADSNTLSGIAASSFVLSNGSGNIDGAAAQKAIPTGDVVGTSDSQTLSNKTLTAPVLNGSITGTGVLDEDNMASNSATALATQQSIKAYVDASVSSGLPSGVVMAYAGSSTPSGWLDCDGSAVSRTTYSSLFGAIGTTWGVGDGSTTFNIPDYRGRTIIGVGTGATLSTRALADSGGTETHTLTTTEMPSHTHSTPFQAIAGGTTSGGATMIRPGSTNTGSAGSGGAHNNMQPYKASYWIIKT